MNISDIIWGGDHKAAVKLSSTIQGLKEGSVVQISLDKTTNKYCLEFDNQIINIAPLNKQSKYELDLTQNDKCSFNTIISIEDDECFIQLRFFKDIFFYNNINTFKVFINDKIVDKLHNPSNLLATLEEKFVYVDKLGNKYFFAKKSKSYNSTLILLSPKNAMNIVKNGEYFEADNYFRYDSSKAYLDSVYLFKCNIEFVESTKNAKASREVISNMNKISSTNSYFEIWDAYSKLEKIALIQHAREIGSVKYNSWNYEVTDVGFKYVFNIEDGVKTNFARDETIDACEYDLLSNDNADDIIFSDKKTTTTNVGKLVRNTYDNKLVIIDSDASMRNTKIPPSGYLITSLIGDKTRMHRCEQAKEKIINNNAELFGLCELIEKGAILSGTLGKEKPITKKLTDNPELKDKKFNEEQIKAIDYAINTPDILLILGPPGTGKTTVIKAITIRFEQYYRKLNDNQIPKILITSYQNEAVNNAINGVENNGLPPNSNSKVFSYIEDWIEQKSEQLRNNIDKRVVYKNDNIQGLSDEILAWEQNGKDLEQGIEILNKIKNDNLVKLPDFILEDIHKFEIKHICNQNVDSTNNNILEDLEEETKERKKLLLLSQRTSKEAFMDDGWRMARKLKMAIELEDIFECDDLSPLTDVIKTKGKDNGCFKKYVAFVEHLKEQNNVDITPHVEDKEEDLSNTLQTLLHRVDNSLKNSIHVRKESALTAESLILNELLNNIQDKEEVKRIVQNYSNVHAATCQKCLNSRQGNFPEKFDLVIVDEAARANPLDLMIPMSLGKKVVLVGDHKQLPHMLSPDVVKEYRAKNKDDEMGILSKSLFERLFNMLESNKVPKRTIRLTKQYRMHPVISEFSSNCFYKDNPQDVGLDSSMVDISKKEANLKMYNNKPLVFLDLSKEKFGAEAPGKSKSRESEVKVILSEIKKILTQFPKKTIGIITFYSAQVEIFENLLKEYLNEEEAQKVKIGTIDAFQGEEFEIVFLSCVRSNNESINDIHRKIGHVNDKNRLCVAFTRSKQLLITVGDSETISCVEEFDKLIRICKEGKEGYYESIEQ